MKKIKQPVITLVQKHIKNVDFLYDLCFHNNST